MQNSYEVYTNDCMQNESHISTYFDQFVVNFLGNYSTELKFGTYWQHVGLCIELMNWNIHCIKLPVIKWNKCKYPCLSRRKCRNCVAS